MIDSYLLPAAIVAAAIAAPFVWLVFVRRIAAKEQEHTKVEAARILEDAERQVASKLRESELAAKEKLLQARSEFEKVASKQRSELDKQERRIAQLDDDLGRQRTTLERRESEVKKRDGELDKLEKQVEQQRGELGELVQRERERLEQVGGFTAQQAKEELMRVMERDARVDAARMLKRIEDEAREQALRESQRIVGDGDPAIGLRLRRRRPRSRWSMLPTDDMKGRIIGREGRNIRALEMATGVDLIVDDTPEAVILSGFDPVPPRDRAHLARAPDRRRPHPPGAHRGGGREGEGGARQHHPAGGRGGAARARPRQRPSRAGQAARPAALPHLVRPELPAPLEGGRRSWPA